jgi:hypothetical protein
VGVLLPGPRVLRGELLCRERFADLHPSPDGLEAPVSARVPEAPGPVVADVREPAKEQEDVATADAAVRQVLLRGADLPEHRPPLRDPACAALTAQVRVEMSAQAGAERKLVFPPAAGQPHTGHAQVRQKGRDARLRIDETLPEADRARVLRYR